MDIETKKVDVKKVLITLVLVLLTAAAVGWGTYYVLNQNFKNEREVNEKILNDFRDQIKTFEEKNSGTNQGEAKKSSEDSMKDWKTYNNENWGIMFKYPPSYNMTKNTVQQPGKIFSGDLWFEDNSREGAPKLSFTFNPDGIGGCMLDRNDYSYSIKIEQQKLVIINKSQDNNSPCDYQSPVVTMFNIGKGDYLGEFKNTIFSSFSYNSGNFQRELDQIINTVSITKPQLFSN